MTEIIIKRIIEFNVRDCTLSHRSSFQFASYLVVPLYSRSDNLVATRATRQNIPRTTSSFVLPRHRRPDGYKRARPCEHSAFDRQGKLPRALNTLVVALPLALSHCPKFDDLELRPPLACSLRFLAYCTTRLDLTRPVALSCPKAHRTFWKFLDTRSSGNLENVLEDARDERASMSTSHLSDDILPRSRMNNSSHTSEGFPGTVEKVLEDARDEWASKHAPQFCDDILPRSSKNTLDQSDMVLVDEDRIHEEPLIKLPCQIHWRPCSRRPCSRRPCFRRPCSRRPCSRRRSTSRRPPPAVTPHHLKKSPTTKTTGNIPAVSWEECHLERDQLIDKASSHEAISYPQKQTMTHFWVRNSSALSKHFNDKIFSENDSAPWAALLSDFVKINKTRDVDHIIHVASEDAKIAIFG
ncbi:hypothetical protein Ae201684_008148 [Aphanomyces euteiches]|uniref:Uncharacterized protein n=1 Tax=Aphanomyces euteiches TaxID=100861 RepID=A0A6G0X5U9_9STRA|nr:hypothetical protein Ae201684_008148 [Aphanomyces euteiches]